MIHNRILVVESSRVFQRLLVDHLQSDCSGKYEWGITTANNWLEAEQLLSNTLFEAIILNPNLKDARAETALSRVKTIAPDTAVVIATSDDDRVLESGAVYKGVQDVLFKPEITPLLLRKTLLFAINRQQLQLVAAEREKLLLSRLAEKRLQRSSGVPPVVEEFGKLLHFLENQFGEGHMEIPALAKQLAQSVLKTRVKVESFKGVNWLSFKIPRKSILPEPVVVSASSESESPKRCLVAEDSLVNQKIVTKVLKQMGYEVTIANNGQEAVETLKSEYFPLVLMDVQMPVMDGVEATRVIRDVLPEIRQPRIIALTASDLDRYSAIYKEAGMDGCLCKPVSSSQLSAELKSFYGEVA